VSGGGGVAGAARPGVRCRGPGALALLALARALAGRRCGGRVSAPRGSAGPGRSRSRAYAPAWRTRKGTGGGGAGSLFRSPCAERQRGAGFAGKGHKKVLAPGDYGDP